MEAAVHSRFLLALMSSLLLGKTFANAPRMSRLRSKQTFREHSSDRSSERKPILEPQIPSYRRLTDRLRLFSKTNLGLDFPITPQNHKTFPELVDGMNIGAVSRASRNGILESFSRNHIPDHNPKGSVLNKGNVLGLKKTIAPNSVQIHVHITKRSANKKLLTQRSFVDQTQQDQRNLDNSVLNSDNLDTFYADPNNDNPSQLDQNNLHSNQNGPILLDTSYLTDDSNSDHSNSEYPNLNSDNLDSSNFNMNKLWHSKLDPVNLIYSHLYSNNLHESQLNPKNFIRSYFNPTNLGQPEIDTDNLENDKQYLNAYLNFNKFNTGKNQPEKSYSEKSLIGRNGIGISELDQDHINNLYLNSYNNLDRSNLNPNNIDYSQVGPNNLDPSDFGQYTQDSARTEADAQDQDMDRNKHNSDQNHLQQIPQSFLADNRATDRGIQKAKCQTEFHFDFLNNWKERSGKIWMSHTGNVKAEDGKARFFGTPQSYLSIPFFSGNDLRPGYRLSLVLESNGASGLPMTVVSNARFRPATFGIYIVRRGVYVAVVPRLDTQNSYLSAPVFVGLPLDTTRPNHIVLDHDDTTQDIWLSVNGRSVHAVARTPMVSSEPLYIGDGSSPFQATQPFSGTISSLSFDKCPRKSNQR